ncbi:hypothetical protein ACQY1Q_05925 [Tenacibaculum sp. TC6]|uniref:hypothetical protein n=1 Tax=Tenacibaculum sp. TC6 TaxID=3423223 RepID=UPI003D360297
MTNKKSNLLTQKTTEPLKTPTLTMMGKGKKIFFNILAVIAVTSAVTASFIHRFFPGSYENEKIIKLNEERNDLKKSWNEKELNLDEQFLGDKYTKEEYIKIKRNNEKKRIADFKVIADKRKVYAHDFSFNGRASLSYWLFLFGLVFTFFIVCCYLAIKDHKLKKNNLLKWYEPHVSVAFMFVALFWMYHLIFAETYDFSIGFYTLFLVIVLIPTSYFIYHVLRRAFTIEEKLLENIRIMVSHILKNTKEEKEDEKWEVLDKVSKNGL